MKALYTKKQKNISKNKMYCDKYGFYKSTPQKSNENYAEMCSWYGFELDFIRKNVFRGIPLFLKFNLWRRLLMAFDHTNNFRYQNENGKKIIRFAYKRGLESEPVFRKYLKNVRIRCDSGENALDCTCHENVKDGSGEDSNVCANMDTDMAKQKSRNCVSCNIEKTNIGRMIDWPAIYGYLATQNCYCEYQIHMDIQRTLRRHRMFYEEFGKGQRKLFRILVAYANFAPEIGYCQGMSNFVGIILMYFPEVETFKLLVTLIQKNNLGGLFDRNLSMIKNFLQIQREVFLRTVPEILKYIEDQDVDIGVFVHEWHLTLFTRFDIAIVLRLWDVFMAYGFVAILFF
ncbi:TBC1 domain family member 3H, partial [Dictyocoela roeselum]